MIEGGAVSAGEPSLNALRYFVTEYWIAPETPAEPLVELITFHRPR
jgi:hypothetical protein